VGLQCRTAFASGQRRILAEAARLAKLSLETVNDVKMIRLDAEIKLGQELVRARSTDELTSGPKKQLVLADDQFKLRDYGISRNLSSRSKVASREINRLQDEGKLTHGGDRKSSSSASSLILGDYGISQNLSSRSKLLATNEEQARALAADPPGKELSVLRRAADLRRELNRRGGARKSKSSATTLILADYGVSRDLSARSQSLAQGRLPARRAQAGRVLEGPPEESRRARSIYGRFQK
jgi:hypothetical protein